MGTLSRMSKKCRECPFRDKCDKKRMEGEAYYGEQHLAEATKNGIAESAAAPVLRETMEINIGGIVTSVYKDDIEKELYKAFREPFLMNYGA